MGELRSDRWDMVDFLGIEAHEGNMLESPPGTTDDHSSSNSGDTTGGVRM
jgi:hypothetical protein